MSSEISTLTFDQIITAVAEMSIDERFNIMEHCVKLLRKESKGIKAKKAKDPNAPKKEANWFMKGSQEVIRPALKDKYFDTTSNTWKDDALKLQPTFTKIAGILKADGYFTPEIMPSSAQVIAAYNKWKTTPTDATAVVKAVEAPKKADPIPVPVSVPVATADTKVPAVKKVAAKKASA